MLALGLSVVTRCVWRLRPLMPHSSRCLITPYYFEESPNLGRTDQPLYGILEIRSVRWFGSDGVSDVRRLLYSSVRRGRWTFSHIPGWPGLPGCAARLHLQGKAAAAPKLEPRRAQVLQHSLWGVDRFEVLQNLALSRYRPTLRPLRELLHVPSIEGDGRRAGDGARSAQQQ